MVAAVWSDAGASRKLLAAALQSRFQLLLSVPLMLEYESVLKRPEHLKAAHASSADIDAILDAVAATGVAALPSFSWRPELSDPSDEMVLETAVNGQSDLIVTFNLTHLRRAALKFGIRAMRPPAALRISGIST
jgi:predicted nucleic acid-binding protein